MLKFDKPRIGERHGSGADDETTRRDFEGDGEEAQLAGRSGDHRRLWPDHAADAGELPAVWLHRTHGPAERKAEFTPGADGNGRGGSAAVSGSVFRSEHQALPREAGGQAPDQTELQLGAVGAAGSGAGGEAAQARDASAEAAEAPAARYDAAHRRQQAPVAAGRPVARSYRDSRRRHQ